MIIKPPDHCTSHIGLVQEECADHADARQRVLLVVVVAQHPRRHVERPRVELHHLLLQLPQREVRAAVVRRRLVGPGLVEELDEQVEDQVHEVQRSQQVLGRRVVGCDVLEGGLQTLHHFDRPQRGQVGDGETVRDGAVGDGLRREEEKQNPRSGTPPGRNPRGD